MAAKKLSPKAEFMLGIVREHTVWRDGELERYFVPQTSRHKIHSVYGEEQGPLGYTVGGSGDAAALRSLESLGFIQRMPIASYAYAATAEGIAEYDRALDRRRIGRTR